jgi:hypothetical protein
MSYCTEVQKMLGIQYKAPHVPIELTTAVGDRNTLNEEFLAKTTYDIPVDGGDDNDGGSNSGIGGGDGGAANTSNDNVAIASRGRISQNQSDVFRAVAQAKHNIRV